MNRRYFLTGLAVVLGAGSLLLPGCGGSTGDNLPPPKPATSEEIEKNNQDMKDQMKAMGKGPKTN